MYFEIYKNIQQRQQYWWVIKAKGNHAVLAHSEMYARKSDCMHAMELVARNAAEAIYYDKTGEI
jgi:uncharacterized protein YegP (UPF0339 family)